MNNSKSNNNKSVMRVYSPDGSELMEVSAIERSGNNILLHGKIMGALPMKAIIRPEQARRGLGLLNLKLTLFLLTILFRW
jgi:hypothetical protein